MSRGEKKPNIHLYIRGNCGNQFFQYAFARTVQEQLDGNLIINYLRVINDKALLAGSDNLLDRFNTVEYKYQNTVDFGVVIFRVLKFIQILFGLDTFQKRTYAFYLWCARVLPKFGIYYFDSAYYPFAISKRKNIYISGYYESPRYFDIINEKICNELQPKEALLERNVDTYSEITQKNSVCVTIKRMDVDNEEIADIYQYDISYFYNAMDYIVNKVEDPIFFIFSDDIEWCRNNIRSDYELRFENEGNTLGEKIRLMSGCKHFIIHNSSFSWWVQHLSVNPDKIVIAPNVWMIRDDQPIDIYEENWIYMNTDGVIVSDHE